MDGIVKLTPLLCISLQLANLGIGRDKTQALFDSANYTFEQKDGDSLMNNVETSLKDYLRRKEVAAKRIASHAIKLHDDYLRSKFENTTIRYKRLRDMPLNLYRDSDIPHTVLPKKISPYFKQEVNHDYRTVKIPDQVPRDSEEIIDAVYYSVELDGVFRQNRKSDQFIRWQYFGTNVGLIRLYPGREWDMNFAGFYNDYDPRIRPWYTAATSGPKDVLIVLDCRIGFRTALELLKSPGRAHCQSIIFVFVTDGKDIDNEEVRCPPGYYTRSGYVPGPVCRYNWTKVWDLAKEQNQLITPRARIFSFLTVDEGEVFPGNLSCSNNGVMMRLTDGEDLINNMKPYFTDLAERTMDWPGLWTAPYVDALGIGGGHNVCGVGCQQNNGKNYRCCRCGCYIRRNRTFSHTLLVGLRLHAHY
ncbi:uncharacterized protein LOC129587423 isoform X2 [Paramacrobiotus metropolitanus]|uniref:uncharacterized protein LOC129587423 isoform X2 n=1 Tax=Paramacrobiotus metropolitanus TaxID=2943436 RepID=UPI00244596F5|nr:uncharacterized protein LOC129587423 isoform X2 [Paramacrobiotus metropolitanus]